ncbi:NACHT domain-containing protein [Streptomyces sp. CoH27]|uniref:NACHT domain-containing protein n=1 Tax=Streptomyces sp. CoH27 TaxID=2875763 RepID=UPI001CD791B1|nr:NACHT domain-containing protein [Streptomyces sp. CoH27]
MSHTGPATATGKNAAAISGFVANLHVKKLVYKVAPQDTIARLKDFKSQVEKRLLEDPRSYFSSSSGNVIDVDFKDASDRRISGKIVSYFNSLPDTRSRLLILGDPGVGKTTAAFQLMSHLLRSWQEGQPVPVRIPLSTWNTERPLLDWLTDYLTEHKLASTRSGARELLDQRLVLPIFDGLDEMDSPDVPVRKSRALRALRRLNEEYDGLVGKARLVVVCRRDRYRLLAQKVRLEHAATVTLQPLISSQQLAFLRESGLQDAAGQWLPEWRGVAEALTWSGTPHGLARVLNTPWRLALLVTGYKKQDAEYRSVRSPDTLLSLPLNEVPQHLLSLYTSAAAELRNQQVKHRHYDPRRAEEWLGLLARGLRDTTQQATDKQDQRAEVVSDTDLVLHRLWLPHKSSTAHAEATMWSIPILIDIYLALHLAHHIRLDAQENFILSFAFTVIVIVGTYKVFAQGTRQPVPTRLDVRRLATRRAIGMFLLQLVGTTMLLIKGLHENPGLYAAILAGYLPAMLFVSAWGEVPDHPQAALTGPRDPLRAELRWALVSAAVATTSLGALFAQVQHSGRGFLYGALLAPLPALTVSALAWRRYLAFHWVMRGKLPLRLAPFLDWCCEAGLLRVEGFAYQFRHRELQDWLAAQSIKPAKSEPATDSLYKGVRDTSVSPKSGPDGDG